MRNTLALKTTGQGTPPKFFAAALLFAAWCLAFLTGCQNPLRPHDAGKNEPPTGAGKGTLSLTIDRPIAERTIRPDTTLEHFAMFRLDFQAMTEGNANHGVTLTRGSSATWTADHGEDWQAGSGAVTLAAGIWDIVVTAYLPGEDGQGLPLNLEAATGRLEGIAVPAGGIVEGSVELLPIAAGEGTFSWRISFPDGVVAVGIGLTRLADGMTLPTWNFGVADFDHDGSGALTLTGRVPLPAGRYCVGFALYRDAGNLDERAGLNAILHVYHNMESRFEWEFTNSHFGFSVPYILAAWDGAQWNFADEVTGWHFYFFDGIYGIDGYNFAGIVRWFNTLTDADNPATVPADLNGLRVLIDAALIGMGTGGDFAINATYQSAVQRAIEAMPVNGSDMKFRWENGFSVLAVGIGANMGDVEDVAYFVRIDS